MADEVVAPVQDDLVSQVAALPDNDDLPSANPQIEKPRTPPKDPATGKFVSSKTPEPTEPAPAPTPPKHSPIQLQIAKRLGIPDNIIQQMTPEELARDLQMVHEFSRQQTPQAAPAAPVVPPPEEEETIDFGIDESQFDPKFFESLRKHIRETKKVAKSAQQENQQLKQQITEYRRQQEVSQFDALCAKNAAVFGKGTFGELNPNSVEATRRAMLHQQMAAFYQDRPWVNMEQAFQHFSQVFGVPTAPETTPEPPAPEPPANRLTPEQWNKAGTLPASSRKGALPPETRFQQLMRQQAAKDNNNGRVAAASGFDDNSDLPKYPG